MLFIILRKITRNGWKTGLGRDSAATIRTPMAPPSSLHPPSPSLLLLTASMLAIVSKIGVIGEQQCPTFIQPAIENTWNSFQHRSSYPLLLPRYEGFRGHVPKRLRGGKCSQFFFFGQYKALSSNRFAPSSTLTSALSVLHKRLHRAAQED